MLANVKPIYYHTYICSGKFIYVLRELTDLGRRCTSLSHTKWHGSRLPCTQKSKSCSESTCGFGCRAAQRHRQDFWVRLVWVECMVQKNSYKKIRIVSFYCLKLIGKIKVSHCLQSKFQTFRSRIKDCVLLVWPLLFCFSLVSISQN